MIDQNSQFYAILTNVGVAKQANADALGIAWKITQMGVGDANGADPQPDANQKTLINEWRRAPLNQLKQDPVNPGVIIAEQVIPAEIGGKWIREIGLYDADGDLVAVANCAPSFKPLLAQGSGRTQVVRMNLIVSNSASVDLKIDPSVVLATREFVLSELAKQDFKSSVMACAPGSIILSGLQTIDGVAIPAGKRVLAPFQTAAKDRGIWVTAVGAWARSTDADISDEVTPGMLVLVEQGTLYGDSAWQLITDAPISLGVTALTFEMAWGRTGVAPGEYRSVTVDKYGRVVAAGNPTTVAGYGLTDVYTKTQIDSALQAKANTASPTLTGIPKAPTPAVSTNSDQIATTAFVQAMFTALIGASPETLNQINEIAAALGNDPNFSTTIMTAMAKLAPLMSPVLTGDPKAPTPALGDNDTSIATTAFVQAALRAFGIGSADNGTGNTLDFNQAPWGSFIKAEGLESDAALYNRPVTGAAGNAPVCFDVLTFGLAGRTTQQATQLFAPAGRGRTFVRVQHDATWFPWREVGMLDSPAFTGWPTAWTVPFNTENTQLANMQALGDAKQGWRGVGIGYTASAVLNPTSVGRWHRVTVAGVTLTLPSKSEVEAGKALAIHNASAGNITIKATGTEVIAIPGGGSSMTLAPNEWVQFAYNSDAIYLPGGRGKLVETAAIDSPVFIGDPRAPTAPVGDSDTTIATTAFVQMALAAFGVGTWTGPLSADLNTTILGGFFRTNSATANSPLTGNMSGIVIPYNNGGCMQIASLLSSNTAMARIYFRTQSSGAWSAWKEFGATDSPVLIGNPTGPTPAPGDSSKSLATTEFVRSAAGDMVGMVGMFAMPTPPDGWLKRNGAAVSRTTYAALFARIGTLWGAGDGSTTFNLPDARGYFDRAWDDARGIDPSRAFATNQATQNQSHGHSGTALAAGAHSHTSTFVREMIDSPITGAGNAVLGDQLGDGYQPVGTDVAGAHTHTLSIANSGGNESRPPNQAYLACIKF